MIRKTDKIICLLMWASLTMSILLASCSSQKIALPSYSKEEQKVRKAVLEENVSELFSLYNANKSIRTIIEDVFYTGTTPSKFDLSSHSYEEIVSYLSIVQDGTPLSHYINAIKTEQEAEIIEHVSSITPEETNKYIKQYPQRKSLITECINDAVFSNVESLSFLELNYLNNSLPTVLDGERINAELVGRKEEVWTILAADVDSYIQEENELVNGLYLEIEKKAYDYFYTGYGNVAKCYSQIGMVPDDPQKAAKQYDKLVRGCLQSNQLEAIIQQEINKFCKEVNSARSKYIERLDPKNSFVPLSIKAPAISFNYTMSTAQFERIYRSRLAEKESRQKSKNAAGVARAFGFNVIATIGQGIYDLSTVSDMAKEEVKNREEYMGVVYSALDRSLKSQLANYIGAIDAMIKKNQTEFKKNIIQNR